MKTVIFEGNGDIVVEKRPKLTSEPNRRGRDRVVFEADEEHWHGAARIGSCSTCPSTKATPTTTSSTGSTA